MGTQSSIAGRVWALSYLESDYTIRISALAHRNALLPSQTVNASHFFSTLVKFAFGEDTEAQLRKPVIELVSVVLRDNDSSPLSLSIELDTSAILVLLDIIGHALIDSDNRSGEYLLTATSLRALSILLMNPNFKVPLFALSSFNSHSFVHYEKIYILYIYTYVTFVLFRTLSRVVMKRFKIS
jgi:hypothetical protein